MFYIYMFLFLIGSQGSCHLTSFSFLWVIMCGECIVGPVVFPFCIFDASISLSWLIIYERLLQTQKIVQCVSLTSNFFLSRSFRYITRLQRVIVGSLGFIRGDFGQVIGGWELYIGECPKQKGHRCQYVRDAINSVWIASNSVRVASISTFAVSFLLTSLTSSLSIPASFFDTDDYFQTATGLPARPGWMPEVHEKMKICLNGRREIPGHFRVSSRIHCFSTPDTQIGQRRQQLLLPAWAASHGFLDTHASHTLMNSRSQFL